jgi:NADH-quinone oxidoreductase subunit C/D
MEGYHPLVSEISKKFGSSLPINIQITSDGIITLWVKKDLLKSLLLFLKKEIDQPFSMLYDLTAIDERRKVNRNQIQEADFTIVYHLTSMGRNQDIRLKTALTGEYPATTTITDIWPSADW